MTLLTVADVLQAVWQAPLKSSSFCSSFFIITLTIVCFAPPQFP
uniref:Uncharacterized protein n=1 Tax=Coprothermobacter proteolyticus (strain ATCC 35245 / DSM 5265 / OCM 4 / BT) TaxID=309798 RepID=B5Y9F6_COPPD